MTNNDLKVDVQDTEDAVVLLPGFLGFSRFGGFRYFADRVSATLRGALENRLHRTVPVVPFSTLPTSPLADRQRQILEHLALLDQKLHHKVKRFHLVGHSTGGLDAVLLSSTQPLGGGAWDSQYTKEQAQTRKKIRSVIGLAAPYHGTLLLEGPLAHVVHSLIPRPKDFWRAVGQPLWSLLFSLRDYRALLLLASAGAASEGSRFCWYLSSVRRDRRLIDELCPISTETYSSKFQIEPDTKLRNFVSIVPPPSPPSSGQSSSSPPERFFAHLYRLTEGLIPTKPPRPSMEILKAGSILKAALVPGNNTPIIGATNQVQALKTASNKFNDDVWSQLNDGIVNSTRQLFDVSKGTDELAGIVIADHGDLIGHYDRKDPYSDYLLKEIPLNEGLFHSNAAFGDDQFFSLYKHVAKEIVNAI
jgi:pimeloyl-ACP methyl ester carboxylesterase